MSTYGCLDLYWWHLMIGKKKKKIEQTLSVILNEIFWSLYTYI